MDYEALAKQYGGTTAAPDYEALAKQFGGTTAGAAPVAPERNRARETFEGVLRGAAGLGNTVLTPVRALANAAGPNPVADYLNSSVQAQGQLDEQNKDSNFYAGGKLGAEIGMTLPVGGAIAQGLRAVPGVARLAPNVLEAIGSAGMKAGTATGANALAARTLGGAITGGAAAGLVDPEHAGAGALIGGALPGGLKLAGAVGNKIGSVIRGPAQSSDMAAAIGAARANGYVIPPTQANPTLANRVLEGFSGKITTAQNASAKNQAVTNRLAAESLGLPGDTKLTADVLTGIRQQAGQAYSAIGSTGAVTPPAAYNVALDAIAAPFAKSAQAFPGAKPSPVLDLVESLRSSSFDAGAAVEKIKQLRTAADDAFRTGNTDVARASRAAAGALEDALDGHLQSIGQPAMLQAFREARQLIAKTYSVEKALNPTTGAVDARKLSGQLTKGKPLSGGLKDAAEFAARFPKAAQTVEGMGSLPQTSPLDWVPAGALSMATSNPLMMAGVAARPAARATILSPLVQNRLVHNGQPNALQNLLTNPDLVQFGYRSAPLVGR